MDTILLLITMLCAKEMVDLTGVSTEKEGICFQRGFCCLNRDVLIWRQTVGNLERVEEGKTHQHTVAQQLKAIKATMGHFGSCEQYKTKNHVKLHPAIWWGWFMRVLCVQQRCADGCCDTPRGELWVKGERGIFFRPRLWGWAQFMWWQPLTGFGSSPPFSTPGKVPSPPPSLPLSLFHHLEPGCLSPCLPPSRFRVTSLLSRSHHRQTVSFTDSPLAPDAASPFEWVIFFRLFCWGHFFTLSVSLYKQKTVIKLHCHSFNSNALSSYTWAHVFPPNMLCFLNNLTWGVIRFPAYFYGLERGSIINSPMNIIVTASVNNYFPIR